MITKTQLKQELVAERKRMRDKQKHSRLLSKTSNIYRAMKRRADEVDLNVPFTLEDLRVFVTSRTRCFYCFEAVTVNSFAVDHLKPIARGGLFDLENCAVVCKSCNWQKGGEMDAIEFTQLRGAISHFRTEVQADIRRRLTIGGKWGVRVAA
jgi:5-methylcytosine-specific restriction endonuclease McrA